MAHRSETPRVGRLSLEVDGFGDWLPGQHVDLRLTAEDGYQAERSYSIASAPESGTLDLIVERLDDGEVSPYLTDELRVDDGIELRGPIGGYFVWHAGLGGPLQLIAGGSGVAPFLAMLDHHEAVASDAQARLLYSARSRDDVIAAKRLDRHKRRAVAVDIALTRSQPDGWPGLSGRVDRRTLEDATVPAADRPRIFICGPTTFVEGMADAMVAIGHPAELIKTERFGGTASQ